MNIGILYEDRDCLVINKPAGIMVHSDGKSDEKTIADWVVEKFPETKEVGEPFLREKEGGLVEKIPRPGIVHRLDKETSGALVIAKNQIFFERLKKQFQRQQIKKTYRALVYGHIPEPRASLASGKRGIIDVPIGRSPRKIGSFTAGRGAKDPIKEARTEYIILNKFFDTEDENEQKKAEHQFTYLEVYPKTGRTHQIRVHLRYINHPVVSDRIYKGKKEMALGLNRLALHSLSITFKSLEREDKTVFAPLPPDFEKVVRENNLKE